MIIILFILWLFFWSFGYALISRIHNHTSWRQWRSLMMGRSLDDRTSKALSRYQLIPLISRAIDTYQQSYKKSIQSWPYLSYRYPISEAIMWCVFIWSYWITILQSGWINDISIIRPTILRRCVINWWLTLLIIYDIKTYELHLPVWIMILWFSLISQFIGVIGNYPIAFTVSLSMGAIMRLLYLWARQRVRMRTGIDNEWLWRGDIYIAFLVGTLRSMIPISWSIIEYISSITEYFTISGIVWLLITIIWMWYQRLQQQSTITLQSAIPFIPALIISYRIILVRYSI